jgi:hypothetical protein
MLLGGQEVDALTADDRRASLGTRPELVAVTGTGLLAIDTHAPIAWDKAHAQTQQASHVRRGVHLPDKVSDSMAERSHRGFAHVGEGAPRIQSSKLDGGLLHLSGELFIDHPAILCVGPCIAYIRHVGGKMTEL